MKDWTGNSKSIFTCHGASNHSEGERQTEDYYATEPKAIEWLMQLENLNKHIWECACGEGHLAKPLIRGGYDVLSTDLVNRGYGQGGIDFLKQTEVFDGDIITNPPYKFAQEFIEHGLELLPEGKKLCMFLKVQFMEGKSRRKLYEENPPKTIWVSSSRIKCGKNGEFKESMVAYAWYVWEKGYHGPTTIKWFN